MIRNILIMSMIFICSSAIGQNNSYEVIKIKSVHGYYVIYATKSGQMYKIVSKKNKEKIGVKIKEGGNYCFEIQKVESIGGNEVDCFAFGKNKICKEPNVELGIVKNMKGLYVLEL